MTPTRDNQRLAEPPGGLCMQGGAFSILEMLVTLVLVSITCYAVLFVLGQTTWQQKRIEDRMGQMSNIHFCMDQIMDDILTAGQSGNRIQVFHDSYDWHDTSRLVIESTVKDQYFQPVWRIDWVAAPREKERDLVLYRREIRTGLTEDQEMYFPLCENLYSFRVQLLGGDALQVDDPNSMPTLIEIQVELFKQGQDMQIEPQEGDVIQVERTFCVNRFRNPEEVANDEQIQKKP